MLSPTLPLAISFMYAYTETDRCYISDKETWKQFNKNIAVLKYAEAAVENIHMWNLDQLQGHEWDSISGEIFAVLARLEDVAKYMENILGEKRQKDS